MYQAEKHGRNTGTLLALMALGLGVIVALRVLPTPPNQALLVGGLAVVFGLYVGSRAAANFIDMLMFDRYILRRKSTRLGDALWIGLNFLTAAVGWLTIVEGTTRFLAARR